MTNTLAAILITVSTNWTTIGTYTPKDNGPAQDVQEGRLYTNTIAILDWAGQRHEMVLEQLPGPSIGERRRPTATIMFSGYGPTNYMIPFKIFTNWYGPDSITNKLLSLKQ